MASDKECSHGASPNESVYQTMAEMDFERGIWNAALNGEMDRLVKMLDEGVDPSLPDPHARNKKVAVCALLLRKGANVNAKTHGGATALHRAAFQGHKDVVLLLLEHGADPEIKDSDGKTSLHKAVEGSHFTISSLLLKKCPQLVHIKDNRGNLPAVYVKPENNELYNMLLVRNIS